MYDHVYKQPLHYLNVSTMTTTQPSQTLHTPTNDAFTVDPNSPYLESQAQNRGPPSPTTASGKRFVGGFKIPALIKRALANQEKRPAEVPLPTPTTGYSSADNSQHYSNPMMHGGSAHAEHTRYAYVSPPSSSDTAYDTHEHHGTDEGYDGSTTAADHQLFSTAPIYHSPVYVEPQPGPDYAKMESQVPSSSVKSFSSYISAVQKFFHDINELPWVAERVTADYVPGQSRRRRTSRSVHRSSSWYGNRPDMGHPIYIDPSSKSSSNPNSPVPVIPVPPPQHAPYTPVAHSRGYSVPSPLANNWRPAYPSGYVPHNEVATMAEQYPGRSFHNMSQVPRMSVTSSVTS